MSTLSSIKSILANEPEEWLAYLYGQQLDRLESYRNQQPRFRGTFLLTLKLFVYMLRTFLASIRLSPNQVPDSPTFFIYSGSANQLHALAGTVAALKKSGETITSCSLDEAVSETSDTLQHLQVKARDIIISTWLFITHAPSLYFRLKKIDPILNQKFFTYFVKSYFYLAIFYRVLTSNRPNFIIVSNDHNVDCRSLLAVAQHLGIKTVYMQHASVSNVFPALTVDYAFLDGQSALETYRECDQHHPPNQEKSHKPNIILSGQKKSLDIVPSDQKCRVGVATNMLDDAKLIVELINYLTTKQLPVSLRWHPRQNNQDIALFRKTFEANPQVRLSAPGEQAIAAFLSEITYLISGNSSIHLEAAIAGVTPIYHEVQPPFIEDYYGYVRHGLAVRLDTIESIAEFIANTVAAGPAPEAVRYYSATYATEWHGREGELVAQSLIKIENGEPVENLWGHVH